MNKRKLEIAIPKAIEALQSPECRILEHGTCDSAFRSQISSFGAAVTMGSLKAAVCFFKDDGDSKVKRSELIRVMHYLVTDRWLSAEDAAAEIIASTSPSLQQSYLNAAVAVKLALNLFIKKKEEQDAES